MNPAGPGSDRDRHVLAVRNGDCVVVEPLPALGEVTEVQRAAGRDGHGSAAGAVRAAPQRVRERVPVVEVADHRPGTVGAGGRQGEGDADTAIASRLGCLYQLLSPLRRLPSSSKAIIPKSRSRLPDLAQDATRRVARAGTKPTRSSITSRSAGRAGPPTRRRLKACGAAGSSGIVRSCLHDAASGYICSSVGITWRHRVTGGA